MGTVKVKQLGMKIRKGKRRWYRHIMRKDYEYLKRSVMEIELLGKRKRGRTKRRFPYVMKEDVRELGAMEKDIENRML